MILASRQAVFYERLKWPVKPLRRSILENTLSTDYLSEIRFPARGGSQLFESEAQPTTK